MRITYLSQTYPPMINGVSVAVQSQAEAMASRGHAVQVITASDRDHPYLNQNGNLTILRLRSFYNPMRVGQRALLYPRQGILRALHDFQPDIIHTHEALQMGWLGIHYVHRAHIPIVLTIPQLPWFAASYLPDISGIRKIAEAALWAYAGWMARKMNRIIAPTQTISTLFANRSGIRTHTISYGIDLETFHPPLHSDDEPATRHKLGLPARVPVLLHVGRLDTDKRVDRLVRAAAQAMQSSDAHLLLVGDGREKSALVHLCKSLGIETRTHFPGFITTEQGLPGVYRLARLFVTASEIETQGIVLLEAAASGLPIAAVRATCIPEIVHHGENGFLSEPGGLDELARSIATLLQNPALAKRMGQASRRLVQVHDRQSTMDLHENLYKQLTAVGSALEEKITRQPGGAQRSVPRDMKMANSAVPPDKATYREVG